MGRPMTGAEKTQFRAWFPLLDVNKAEVSGPATRVYNCIAWTVGVTGAWLWPGSTIGNFDTFYARYGFHRSSSGPIAAWGVSIGQMKHGCVSGPHHGPRWESKCGQSLRIEHGLNELVSGGYGRVLAFYSQTTSLAGEVRDMIEAVNSGNSSAMLTDEHIAAVRAASEKLPPNLRARFETAFTAWKRTWSLPHVTISSNPASVTFSAEFQRLVALGPETLPAVVEKLIEPDNFFALQLYDLLQPEQDMTLFIDSESELVFEGEQGRARRTVERFASNLYEPR